MQYKKLGHLAIATAIVFSVTSLAESAEMQICVNKKTGALRAAKRCKKLEYIMDLASVGLVGTQGPQGPIGPQGNIGPQGPQGNSGSSVQPTPCELGDVNGHWAIYFSNLANQSTSLGVIKCDVFIGHQTGTQIGKCESPGILNIMTQGNITLGNNCSYNISISDAGLNPGANYTTFNMSSTLGFDKNILSGSFTNPGGFSGYVSAIRVYP